VFADEPSQVVGLAEWKRGPDHLDRELTLFIEHAIVPILVRQWVGQTAEKVTAQESRGALRPAA
jgi:hypothetical protein